LEEGEEEEDDDNDAAADDDDDGGGGGGGGGGSGGRVDYVISRLFDSSGRALSFQLRVSSFFIF
jgi:hypothetical protein